MNSGALEGLSVPAPLMHQSLASIMAVCYLMQNSGCN